MASSSSFPSSGTVQIGSELITYTGNSGGTLTGLTRVRRFQQDDVNRGRSGSRSNSLRKRDSSWDRKWVDQVRRNKEEDGIMDGNMKRETSPGRLNNGLLFWERRSRQELR